MSVGTEGPSDGWGGATPGRPFTYCRNVSCIVARMDCMSSNGSGPDLATDEATGRPAFSPWSEAEQSPALLEVQWKVMTREEAGWRREEGSPGQVEGALDLQALVWSPSDGGPLRQVAEREREIKFIGLFEDRGHRGPYSPYKPFNHNLYIGIIIFPHIDNPQSTGYN